MLDIGKLRTAIQPRITAGYDDQEILDWLRELSGTAPVPSVDVKRYLILQGKWAPVAVSSDLAAVNMRETLDNFETIDTVEFENQIAAALDAVIAADLIDAADKAAIMALGENRVPRWRALMLGTEPALRHIADARRR